MRVGFDRRTFGAGLAMAILMGGAPTAAAPAGAVAGSWKGSHLGTVFTFEFKRTGQKWTGRAQSEKFRKWEPLHDVVVSGQDVRFRIASQPPLIYSLKLDQAGKALTGVFAIGTIPNRPLQLARVS